MFTEPSYVKPVTVDRMTTDLRDSEKNKIIHVAFGRGGGRLSTPSVTDAEAAAVTSASDKNAALEGPAFQTEGGTNGQADPQGDVARPEPAMDLYSAAEVERLLGISRTKLRSLEKAEVVVPTGLRKGKRAYTFSDLIALRATAELLKQQVKMRDVARAIHALRKTLPRVIRPLQELRIVSDGSRVVVRADDVTFEPISGQTLFDFRVDRLEQDVVRVLRPEAEATRKRTAYDLYIRGSSLDENPETYDEAEMLYRKAIELDGSLAIAYTNLGNLRFRQGDESGAEALYHLAIKLDEGQAEANYNLGYLMLERVDIPKAVSYLERATIADPSFADAHFNLAMAYESAAERAKAQAHWRKYLDLDPKGAFSEVAERHLLGR
jgi:tetratricopeptide (TPR) repeat protein